MNPAINQVLVQYADPVMNRMRNTVTSASRTFDRMQQGHNLLRKKKYAVKSKTIRFFRDPFRLRETVKNSLVKTKIWKRASKKIAPVRNATTFIQHILAKAVAGTSAAIQTILSLLSGILQHHLYHHYVTFAVVCGVLFSDNNVYEHVYPEC